MFDDSDVVYTYSREQALADGDLVDVSAAAREAGLRFPVALTSIVWRRYVQLHGEQAGQSLAGRLWDLVWMLRCAAQTSETDTVVVQLLVAIPGSVPLLDNESRPMPSSDLTLETHRVVVLKAMVGPGDTGEPVITVAMPNNY